MPSTITDRLNGLTTSIAVKAPCRAATAGNITLSGEQTIDGIAVVSGDRVLVKDQTSAIENGIYVAATAAWTRAADFDGSLDMVGGTQIYVISGTTNSNTYWRVAGEDTSIVVGTDSVTFAAAGLSDSAAHSFLQAGTGAKARSTQSKIREIAVSLVDFQNDDGTTPIPGVDCSTAWQRVVTHCNTVAAAGVLTGYQVTTAKLFIPPSGANDWVITTGATIAHCNLVIEGHGKSNTRIRIGSGQYLLTATATMQQFELRGVSTSGGAGVLAHVGTSNSVAAEVIIEHNNFHDYTVCAISSLSEDNPYWKIQKNLFRGAAAYTSIGVALPGARDMSCITDCVFLLNRYDMKLGNGGNNVKVRDNDMIRFASGGGSPVSVNIWIVPKSSATNAGNGCEIIGNKFGNENLHTGDIRILVADEGAGTDFRDKPHSTSASSGYWVGARVEHNVIGGIGGMTKGAIYSYTPNIRTGTLIGNGVGTKYPYLLQYDAGVSFAADDRTGDTNIIGWGVLDDGVETYTGPASSQPSAGLTHDPLGLMQAQPAANKTWESGCDVSFVDILSSNDITGAGTTNASVAGAADAIGGDNAVTATYTNAVGEVYMTLTGGNITVGRIAWVEFDLMAAASQPLTRMDIQVRTDASAVAVRRVFNIPAYWMTCRFPWIPRQSGTTLRLKFIPGAGAYSAGVTDQVKIGRPRIYHAHEPVHLGARFLEGKATYNPPSLADGEQTETTVTVDGAALGDFALASFSVDVAGVILRADVTSANTVSVIFQNESAGVVDLASGTLRARVLKFAAA